MSKKARRSSKSGSASPDGYVTAQPSRAAPCHRLDGLDALRGFALLWMALFHFCFDLSHQGLLTANFYLDPLWTTQRTLILSLFLLCAGAGQALALANAQSWAHFWRRWGQIAACAVVVTLVSRLMFGERFITFGVLHALALMLPIARLSAPLGRWLWPLGAIALSLPLFVQHPFFDHPATNWVGLVTHKPPTEDFVPLLPWLGLVWWGMAGMQWHLARDKNPRARAAGRNPPSGLATLGRWSLSFYMLHQPLLIGAIYACLWLKGQVSA